jgi:hypothetical protein
MLKLAFDREPFWLDLLPGVRVQFRPITVAAILLARTAAADVLRAGGEDAIVKAGVASLPGPSGGIRDRPISPGSPWQNGIAERLIGTPRVPGSPHGPRRGASAVCSCCLFDLLQSDAHASGAWKEFAI